MNVDHISSDDFAAAVGYAAQLSSSGEHRAAMLMKRLADEIVAMRFGCLDGVTADPRIKAEHAALSAIPRAIAESNAALLSSLAATLTALHAR